MKKDNYGLITTAMNFDDIPFPETLYKYRNWNDERHQTIISKREVYFSPPHDFQDEFDCRIPTRWDLLTYEDKLNYYWIDSRYELQPSATIDERIEFAVYNANNNRLNDKEFVAKHQQETFFQFNERFGILSLTPFNNLPELWENYGNMHQGFSIGFEPHPMLKGIGTGYGKVEYKDELPVILPLIKMPFEVQFSIQMFFKLKNWEFEEEFRTYKSATQTLTIEDRVQVLPVSAYKEIIIGAKMCDEDILELLNSIPAELKHIKIKKASIVNNQIIINDYDSK